MSFDRLHIAMMEVVFSSDAVVPVATVLVHGWRHLLLEVHSLWYYHLVILRRESYQRRPPRIDVRLDHSAPHKSLSIVWCITQMEMMQLKGTSLIMYLSHRSVRFICFLKSGTGKNE